MRNAKDYIEKTGEQSTKVTSLAYWLTPEGLNNPLVASLLRDTIAETTDEQFRRDFDGATKEEASLYLDEWELCNMSRWGHPELVKIITLSDTTRNENLVARAISMAQSVSELSELFTPTEGIQWAMKAGYLINSNVSLWCCVKPGVYGSPYNGETLTNQVKPETSDFFTSPPTRKQELFLEVEALADNYIQNNGGFPTTQDLWEMLKAKHESSYDPTKKSIQGLSKSTNGLTRSALRRRLIEWGAESDD